MRSAVGRLTRFTCLGWDQDVALTWKIQEVGCWSTFRLIRCSCPWRAQDGALPSSWRRSAVGRLIRCPCPAHLNRDSFRDYFKGLVALEIIIDLPIGFPINYIISLCQWKAQALRWNFAIIMDLVEEPNWHKIYLLTPVLFLYIYEYVYPFFRVMQISLACNHREGRGLPECKYCIFISWSSLININMRWFFCVWMRSHKMPCQYAYVFYLGWPILLFLLEKS